MQLTGQWADTLLALELLFLTKLLVWGAITVAAGSSVLALFAVRNIASRLVNAFSVSLVVLGSAAIVVSLLARTKAELRDLPSAISLERIAWFASGLEVGLVLIGLALAIAGSVLGKRPALVGAGIALSLHASALLILTLQLAASVVR